MVRSYQKELSAKCPTSANCNLTEFDLICFSTQHPHTYTLTQGYIGGMLQYDIKANHGMTFIIIPYRPVGLLHVMAGSLVRESKTHKRKST